MSESCPKRLRWEDLVAYWAGDLEPADVDHVEEHLMGCATCTAESARVAAITEALRALIPPLIDHARLAELRARGLRIVENIVMPDERRTVRFALDTDILLHRFRVDLTGVERVSVRVTVEETGDLLHEEANAPFDGDSGELLVACQRHFASLPPNVAFDVQAHERGGTVRTARFLVPHIYERSAEA